MGLDLSHVLFDGELFALEKARLLTLVHVEGAKCVYEIVCLLAVVLVSLDH